MSEPKIYFLVLDHHSKAGIGFVDDNEIYPTTRQGAVDCVGEERNA